MYIYNSLQLILSILNANSKPGSLLIVFLKFLCSIRRELNVGLLLTATARRAWEPISDWILIKRFHIKDVCSDNTLLVKYGSSQNSSSSEQKSKIFFLSGINMETFFLSLFTFFINSVTMTEVKESSFFPLLCYV